MGLRWQLKKDNEIMRQAIIDLEIQKGLIKNQNELIRSCSDYQIGTSLTITPCREGAYFTIMGTNGTNTHYACISGEWKQK